MKTLIAVVALTGILRFGDAAVTGWTTPTITGSADGSGTLFISETQAISTTITTYVATAGSSSITYALTPAVPPFALSTAGVLTITSKLADDATTPTYTLNIIATETGGASGTATITVTVTNDEAPVFGQASYTVCIADGSTAGDTLITVLATDSDLGETVTHSIASGNTGTDFVIDGSTGVITVSTGSTFTTGTTYTLVVIAKDDDTPVKTGTTTVSVEVTSDGTCSGALTVAVSVMTLLMALVVTL